MSSIVAIVGRPNVGKSTLFNRFIGERKAIVNDRPGVTRDRIYAEVEEGNQSITFIDTGGFEPQPGDDLFTQVRQQAEIAIEQADLLLFVVDRQAGITPADEMTGAILRKMLPKGQESKLIVVVNKCDLPQHEVDASEFWALGFAELQCVSAEHGNGFYELWASILERLSETIPDELPDDEGEIRIAVLGRPNIGKSTLVNRMVGQDRHVVHDAPGTTMDAIDSVIEVQGQQYRFVDTAGVRRRSKIDDRLESFAVSRAIKTIERCHVSLLMIDGTEGITHQDARLAALIADRGRACIVLINRWDLVRQDPDRNVHVIKDELETSLPHLYWAPELYISALTGKGCQRILPLVNDVYEQFDKRISTSRVNHFLQQALLSHSPPQKNNHRVRLNYITQTRVRPPTFVIWGNNPEAINAPYKRYLENRMRDEFGFDGTPLRIQLKKKRRQWEEGD
jgi:GTPase